MCSPAAGPTARAVARSDWASRVFRRGQGGLVAQCAGRLGSPGAPWAPGGEVMARRGLPVPQGSRWGRSRRRHPQPGALAHGRRLRRRAVHWSCAGRGGVRRAVARRGPRGEVLAHQGDTVCCALAAGLPRGCAQRRGSQPWAGGVRPQAEPTGAPPQCRVGIRGRWQGGD